ncbi:MAG: acyltransferase [Proteobacteria bacterium]|nr:MAG: acyltransferase [Pseudomonadota bacterium]
MQVTLKLARIDVQMRRATLVRWHERVGESFETGEVLYEIETEKITQEVAATGAGMLRENLVPQGARAEVGRAVCVVEKRR